MFRCFHAYFLQVMTLTLREEEFDSTTEVDPEHSAPRVAAADDIHGR
jgi:hypothetical protein